MKHTLDIKDTDPLLLFGVNDQNLKVLSANFDARVVARGGRITIEGTAEEVKFIKQVFEDMILTINRKGHLTRGDVAALVKVAVNGEVTPARKERGDRPVILYAPRGVVAPRTDGQQRYFEDCLKNDIAFAIGPAGTGKTFQAVAVAIAALKAREVERLILTRPAVEAGERLGFLPGDLKEKVEPYLTPLYDALNVMLPPEKVRTYLDQHIIEIAPLAYMRGRTLNSAFVILDEAQNASPMQMKMFLTRLGANSKAIITGDITQSDLPPSEESGLIQAMHILEGIDGIAFCRLTEQDVVRHRLVKEILKAYQGFTAD